ncbi:MAG: hypothetical protein KDE31_37685, partial [Caldilineaceae bacterium]|nr:hypothetical protein [Caldilineaceae bacterium]
LLDSAQVTPIQGIQRTLSVVPEPAHAASNYFWIVDLLDQAKGHGLGALLTGQGGNATVSWTGAPQLRSRLDAFRHGGIKTGLRRNLPGWALRALRKWRMRGQTWDGAAIHVDFAARLDLAQRRTASMHSDITLQERWRCPRDHRYAVIQPGASRIGDLWARWGAVTGLEVRDPTLDTRVMAYTISVPDPIFDSPDGADRWMMRAKTHDLLPDEVRLNRLRGRQSADLIERLMASAEEVEAALTAVDTPPSNAYVDIVKMRQAWTDVQSKVTPVTTHRAGTILLRGLLAGLFLNHSGQLVSP